MKKRFILALAALLTSFQWLVAIPARPGRLTLVQPDGTKIVVTLHGDEFGHWTTDLSGRLLRQDADGFYRVDTETDLPSLQRRAMERRSNARRVRSARAQEHIAIGQKHFLVILVAFKDLGFKVSNPQQAFTNLLNESGYSLNGGTGSARDFYYDNSHGLFEPIFDVYGPVKLDQNYSYYGSNSGENDTRPEEALIDGCKGLDEEIDFSKYDNDGDGDVDMVFMYYAGHNEAEGGPTNSIWPHMWELSAAGKTITLDGVQVDRYACTSELRGASGTTMCGIGTACHEFGHAMGLPDMYDTDYTTNGNAGGLYSGLYVLAAISSLGKTSFALQLADQLAERGNDIIFFSLEQSKLELVSKSIARRTAQNDINTAVTSLAIRKGFLPQRVLTAVQEYKKAVSDRISIVEGNFKCNISSIGDYIRQYVRRSNTRLPQRPSSHRPNAGHTSSGCHTRSGAAAGPLP